MLRDEVSKLLLDAPARCLEAEKLRDEQFAYLLEARRELHDAECNVLLGDALTGKNEQIRNAQMVEETAPERIRVSELEIQLRELERGVRFHERTFEMLTALVKAGHSFTYTG